jgi:hypothetical protein
VDTTWDISARILGDRLVGGVGHPFVLGAVSAFENVRDDLAALLQPVCQR